MGISTGGVIAQHFAAEHPRLVHRLVLAMTGHSLSKEGKELQRQIFNLLRQGKWGAAYSSLITGVYPRSFKKYIFKPLMWLTGTFSKPADLSGALVEIEAEDRHDFKNRLSELKMPTLVIGGEEDFFYPIRDTAEGIPGAMLVIYSGFGHNTIFDNRNRFTEDIIAFLTETDDVFGSGY
jgi:pimeloyl-ACP methyl ester carboxylesterase